MTLQEEEVRQRATQERVRCRGEHPEGQQSEAEWLTGRHLITYIFSLRSSRCAANEFLFEKVNGFKASIVVEGQRDWAAKSVEFEEIA